MRPFRHHPIHPAGRPQRGDEPIAMSPKQKDCKHEWAQIYLQGKPVDHCALCDLSVVVR